MRKEVCAEIEEQDTPDPDEFCTKEPLEKGKEKERSQNHLFFTTGGFRIPEINSPADIYKHSPRRVAFEDELSETESSGSEKIGSRENTSDSDGQLSYDHTVRSPSNTRKTGTCITVGGKTVKKMFHQETSKEVAAELLHSYQQTFTTWHKRC